MALFLKVKRRTITYNYTFPSERLDKIRPTILKRMLKFYKWAYLDGDVDLSQLNRSPRLHPGLSITMKHLDCRKLTALDYLNSIYVIRKGFVEPAINSVKKSNDNIISDKIMKKIRIIFRNKISDGIKISGINEVKRNNLLNLREADEALNEAINIITEYEGLFTTEQVIDLLKDFKEIMI